MADAYVIGFKLVFEILERLSVDTSTNQEAINKLPIRLTFIMCILYAPVVEETIYRYCLKEIVYNKFLFVICSGLLFGMAHVVFGEATVYMALVCSLPLDSCLLYGRYNGYLDDEYNLLFKEVTIKKKKYVNDKIKSIFELVYQRASTTKNDGIVKMVNDSIWILKRINADN